MDEPRTVGEETPTAASAQKTETKHAGGSRPAAQQASFPKASAPKAAARKPAGAAAKPAAKKTPAAGASQASGAKKAASPKPAAKKTTAKAAKPPEKKRDRHEKQEAAERALTPEQRRLARKKHRRNRAIGRIVGRFFLYIFTVFVAVFIGAYLLLYVVFKGPSPTAGDKLTLSLLETSAGKFVPYLYFTKEEVAAIVDRNKVVELDEETDVSLIVINTPAPAQQAGTPAEPEEDDLVIDELKGATYHGWMMVVKDPSRVSVGISADYFTEKKGGLRIAEMAEKYGAIAAINGGAFHDHNGQGNGGMPEGVTISQGKLTNAMGGADLTTVGFDENNVLIMGKMTRDQAVQRGLRDAVSFGPALVVNGESAKFSGVSSGLNPRTAIGQRADGAVLMLVIDGRQVNSLGASLADLAEIMLRYGAVNACNLDGGSSSNIYYDGEILNDGVVITGSRRIPTAFIVR